MADNDKTKWSHEEFERRSRQFALNQHEKELNLWDLKPSKRYQGSYLAARRYTKFIGYQLVKSTPRLYFDKVFTPAYQPFSIRNSVFLFSATVIVYLKYIYDCKRDYRKQILD